MAGTKLYLGLLGGKTGNSVVLTSGVANTGGGEGVVTDGNGAMGGSVHGKTTSGSSVIGGWVVNIGTVERNISPQYSASYLMSSTTIIPVVESGMMAIWKALISQALKLS